MGRVTRIENGRDGVVKNTKVSKEGFLYTQEAPYPPITKNKQRIYREYMTQRGGGGNIDMKVDGSVVPIEFTIESEDNYDIYITAVSFLISADNASTLAEFGSLGTTLTNGCDFFAYIDGVEYPIGVELKSNFDFVRMCKFEPAFGTGPDAFRIDGVTATAGSDSFSPVLKMTSFGYDKDNSVGLRIKAGTNNRLVLRINDNLNIADTELQKFNVIVYGNKRKINDVKEPLSTAAVITGGGAVFPPQTNLVSDFNAAIGVFTDAGVTTATNGDNIQEWHDQSSLGLIAEQTSNPRKPTWFASDAAGNPYVDFPGLDYMTILSTTSYRDSDLTFYIVSDVVSPAAFDTILNKSTDSNWDDGWWIGMNSTPNMRTSVNQYPDNEITSSYSIAGKGPYYMQFKTSAPTKEIAIGDSSGTRQTLALAPGFDTNDAPLKDTLLGASWNSSGSGPTLYYDGYIYRILIYNTYHDVATVNAIMTQLNLLYP